MEEQHKQTCEKRSNLEEEGQVSRDSRLYVWRVKWSVPRIGPNHWPRERLQKLCLGFLGRVGTIPSKEKNFCKPLDMASIRINTGERGSFRVINTLLKVHRLDGVLETKSTWKYIRLSSLINLHNGYQVRCYICSLFGDLSKSLAATREIQTIICRPEMENRKNIMSKSNGS